MELLVPVSAGELLDKITILQIKAQRIGDPAKRANVAVELAALEAVAARAGLVAGAVLEEVGAAGVGADGFASVDPVAGLVGLAVAMAELGTVNGELWDIEDSIRDCERGRRFWSWLCGAGAVCVSHQRPTGRPQGPDQPALRLPVGGRKELRRLLRLA